MNWWRWLLLGLVLFFGFGLRVSPLNFTPFVEIGVSMSIGCFIAAFCALVANPQDSPFWPRD